VAPKGFLSLKCGPWPKRVVHHCCNGIHKRCAMQIKLPGRIFTFSGCLVPKMMQSVCLELLVIIVHCDLCFVFISCVLNGFLIKENYH
jgi:hypothetical protein